MRATIRRGFSFNRMAVGERPSFSRTPGRKGSIRMSVVRRRRFKRARARGDFRSRVIEVLRRVRLSGVGGGGGELCAWRWGRSMRRTEAP